MRLHLVAWTPEGVREIPLLRKDGSIRAFAWVDEIDYEWLSRYRWFVNDARGGRYLRVNRLEYDPATQRSAPVRMHRQIMGLKPGDGLTVDHINRNPLDNRRRNLRVCTHAENRQNNGANRNSRSGIRGVRWDEKRRKWETQVTLDYKNHHLGRYERLEDAMAAVADFRREHMPYSTT